MFQDREKLNTESEENAYTSSRRFADADKLVRAKVERTEIQMLVKLVEGLGHLGVVTTTDKLNGEVLIQSTRDCWPDLEQALLHMPFKIEFLG